MKRRALFGFLSVSPVALAGAAMASSVAKSDAPPEGQVPGLALLPSKPPTAKEPPTSRGQLTFGRWPKPDYSRQIEINVGADGNLWVRPNGKPWQRLLTG